MVSDYVPGLRGSEGYKDPKIVKDLQAVTLLHTVKIATGETSQAITPFHFFDNLNFHHLVTFITR